MDVRAWAAAVLLILVGTTGAIIAIQQTNLQVLFGFLSLLVGGLVIGVVDSLRNW